MRNIHLFPYCSSCFLTITNLEDLSSYPVWALCLYGTLLGGTLSKTIWKPRIYNICWVTHVNVLVDILKDWRDIISPCLSNVASSAASLVLQSFEILALIMLSVSFPGIGGRLIVL